MKNQSKAEEWEARFNEKFIEKDLQMEKEGHVIRANKNLVLLFEIETFIHQELSRQREEIKIALLKIREWPEPQKGAGEGIGPLAGVGMYMQYDSDRKKHKEQIDDAIQVFEEGK